MKQERSSFCLELLHISLMLMGILLSKSKNRYVQQTWVKLSTVLFGQPLLFPAKYFPYCNVKNKFQCFCGKPMGFQFCFQSSQLHRSKWENPHIFSILQRSLEKIYVCNKHGSITMLHLAYKRNYTDRKWKSLNSERKIKA